MLGTQLGAEIQDSIHELSGSDNANGWDHQISDGGEPTFQYSVSRQTLLGSGLLDNEIDYELKYSLSSSIGYITEANASVSTRWGHINTPWWSFTPENADYAYRPAPVVGTLKGKHKPELYLWGGAKLRARAYNAFLQGQLRDSEVTYSSSELNPLIFEA